MGNILVRFLDEGDRILYNEEKVGERIYCVGFEILSPYRSISTKICQNGGDKNLIPPKMGKMVELGTYLHQNMLKWWSKEINSTKNG